MDQPAQDIPVDEQFLKEMGLEDLSQDQRPAALSTILNTLNQRVAERVADSLSEDKIDEFDQMMDGEPDEPALASWLQANVPNYQQLINDEAEQMRQEAISIKDKVMGQGNGPVAV
jgi:uncharacterized protein DUF5663